ncbi:hypothetical protein HMN09_00387300 [Mycena chlorophos]|uniref:F-box domain-containing protein n=1 Tax=Mycena chlorophos TaxID=658473 RepID=A0A8H6TJM3_MYCCL|nr:hypothetical protein HMN09_00387300 [Mycena chlorophos]
MRRIPDDVWGLIFLETLPERRNTALHATEGPLLLVQVCRYWRDLAYSLPGLWASMHVVVGDASEDQEAVRHVIGEIPTWLKRSGAVPLAVTIARARGSSSTLPEGSATRALLKLLLPETKRWRDIQLMVVGIEDLVALGLLTLSADDVPQLARFDLKFIGAPLARQQPPFNFLSTPSLRKLSFVGPYSMLSGAIQWQNLKAIQVHFTSRINAQIPFPYPFLSHCASLEQLSLHILGNLVSSQGDMDPVQLSQVTVLHISLVDNGPTRIAPLLRKLEFPALHTLCIWEAQVLHPRSLFDSPGFTGIKCLVFPASKVTSPQMYAILAMLPLLERLRLLGEPTAPAADEVPAHLRKSDAQFLSRFVLDAESIARPPLCPLLQHLEFTMLQHTSDALILSLLRSRAPPTNIFAHAFHPAVKPLTAFSARICRPSLALAHKNKLDLEKELSVNIACGLKLQLCYQHPGNAVLYSRLHGTERHPLHPRHVKPESEWLLDFEPTSFLD